jgi:uncharacterized membrane protein YeaQ/YmgE (transglycosylase-associated protein family)
MTGCMTCGEGGIRTHGTRKGTTVFETVPIVRSGTSPMGIDIVHETRKRENAVFVLLAGVVTIVTGLDMNREAKMDPIVDAIEWVIKAPFVFCGWLIVGFLAGGFGRFIMRSPDKHFISDIILGLCGAVIGGIVMSVFGVDTGESAGLSEWITTLVVATIGAVILIFAGRMIGRRKTRRRR